MRKFFVFIFLLFLLIKSSAYLFAQSDTLPGFKTVIAGKEYKASGWYKWLWGSNYRNVWTTPVSVKVLNLDTAKGGLTPIKEGGGHQTQTLHLSNADSQDYSIRSVDKTLGKVLPEQLQGTYAEYKADDEVSMSNPYAAITIPYMAEHANIYHTNPSYVYVPKQPALKEFNEDYGDNLYLFEEHVDGNWKNADNLGNFENFIDTDKLLDTLKHSNDITIDVKTYIRSRLFDMFINDWDRHEGQWSWGERKTGNATIYVPVPVDRDQAYSTHNGLILTTALKAGGLKYMQPFNDNLKDVKIFNYEQRNLDRRLTINATLNDWQSAATELQKDLTNDVIETAVHNLPKEIFPLVGNDIIKKLEARRNHIFEWATEYYQFISKEVEIPGSNQNEEFDVQRLNDDETLIQVFALNNDNKKNDTPFISRTFKSSETREIRLFGLEGNDKYIFSGGNDNDTRIKIIDGLGADSVIAATSNKNIQDLKVYSDPVRINTNAQFKISDDTVFRSYRYDWYRYDKKGFTPKIFYTHEDRLFVGIGYHIKNYEWDRQPFASNQLLDYHYSLMEKSYSLTYRLFIPNPVKRFNTTLLANYDNIRWTYFFGLGNDSKFTDKGIKYYTVRTRQWLFQPGVTKSFGRNTVGFFADMQGIKILDDTDRYISKTPANQAGFDWQTYVGSGLSYSYQNLNDPIVPTKGIYFNASASGEQNLHKSSGNYIKFAGVAHGYIPLVSKFSLNIRAGISKITGNPEFYQYPSIGGTILRGFKRDRFRGEEAFYNTNDLRFISKIHSYFFSGKAGLLVFFDQGRVWMPQDDSNTWHTAFGGGVIVAPLSFLYLDATYGRGDGKESTIQVRLTYAPQ